MDEKIKQEALRRMKILRLDDGVPYACIPEFKKHNKIFKSEFHGMLHWIDEKDQKIIDQFEDEHKEYGMKVYHCYKAHIEEGDILYLLYVSKMETSWPIEFDYGIDEGVIRVFAANILAPEYSEFREVFVYSQFGGIFIN